ncbi:hypothetical protein FGO68_gene10363 [Halteria grandinella]|uniref:Glutathione S-transferase family protein n=1 Tax=Halteria grandinella TaxID=5974 RepID=A0A8J8SZI9_HALGN|nr:hypothetical protein FGO68_gene10363 [Halteria grandinella]
MEVEQPIYQTLKTFSIRTADTPKPPTNKNYPRLYTHILCPFAERARIALAAKGVQYQTVNVDLDKKTSWHAAINGGVVPFLEIPDGTIITESKIIMEFVEEAFPTSNFSLLPEDPVLRAKMRIAVLNIDAYIPAYYGILIKRVYDEADFVKLRGIIQKLEDIIASNAGTPPYALGTKNPTQLDAHIFPLLERHNSLKDTALHWVWEHTHFENYPHILKLLTAFRENPSFSGNKVLFTKPFFAEHIQQLVDTPIGGKVGLVLPENDDSDE